MQVSAACAKQTKDEAETSETGYCGVGWSSTGKTDRGPGRGRAALQNLTAVTLRNIFVIPTQKTNKRGGEIPSGNANQII